MVTYDDEERERPSWREIDRMKDRSKHVTREKLSYREKKLKTEWAKRQYLKKVEDLFKGKKGTSEHKQAYQALHDTYGTKKFHKEVESYLKEYGFPDDWSTLFLLLDYKDPDVVIQVIDLLKEMFEDQSLNVQEGFKSKLRIISMTSENEQLKEKAEDVLKIL